MKPGTAMKLGEVARKLGARLEGGDATLEVAGVAGVEEAGPRQLTFITNGKYAAKARQTRAAAVIVAEDFPAIAAPTLRSRNPHLAYARALELFHPPPLYKPEVHPTAVVAASAKLGPRAHLGPYVVIGEGAEIGADAVLLAHVVIYAGARIGDHFFAHAHAVVREGCRIGDRVILQNGVVVGSDGYGFAKDEHGAWHKVPQAGIAELGDDVEVQAGACIDRGSVSATRIARGVKIDNLVHVGHNSEVGENTLLCAQTGLAGSSTIGRNAILTGQVGVVGHCTVGDGAIVTPQSGVAGDIEAGKMVSGSPAVEHREWLRYSALLPRLPEMARALRAGRRKATASGTVAPEEEQP